MVKRVDEYVQVPGVATLKKELSDSNYEVLEAMNKTIIMKEVIAEKEAAIHLAKQIAKSLVPEVQLLNMYIRNETPPLEEDVYEHRKKKSKVHRKRVAVKVTRAHTAKHKITTKSKAKPKTRSKQVNLKDESHTLKELKKNLAKIRRQLNE